MSGNMSDLKVEALRSALVRGSSSLDNVPKLVKDIIREELWKERTVHSTGQTVHFDSFTEFCTTDPPEGIGCEVDRLKRLCSDDDEASLLIRKATTNPNGVKGNANNNITGTAKDYTLDRLSRERPDLYEAVVEGEMSANAAAIEAGFRTKTVSVPVMKGGEPQIERAADALQKHFGDAFPDLVDELMSRLEVAA